MIDMFAQMDKCDKHFNEGIYAPVKKEIIKKDPEEVVHIEDNEPEETNDNSGEADNPDELKEVEE